VVADLENCRSLRFGPGFPVEVHGVDEIYAAPFKGEPHTWSLPASRSRKSGYGMTKGRVGANRLLCRQGRVGFVGVLRIPPFAKKSEGWGTRHPASRSRKSEHLQRFGLKRHSQAVASQAKVQVIEFIFLKEIDQISPRGCEPKKSLRRTSQLLLGRTTRLLLVLQRSE
jgi:hypothetical protein